MKRTSAPATLSRMATMTSDRTELDRLKAENAELHADIRVLLDHLERLAASMEQPEFARFVRFLVDKYRRDKKGADDDASE